MHTDLCPLTPFLFSFHYERKKNKKKKKEVLALFYFIYFFFFCGGKLKKSHMQNHSNKEAFKPFLLSGTVIHGYGRGGTQLGFPTANLELDDNVRAQLKPYKNLVLFGWGSVIAIPGKENCGEGPYPFSMSIGYNPHFHGVDLTAEVYFIHEFAEDFYGAVVNILVLGDLREMGAFVSLEALVDAIKDDVRKTEEALQKPELKRLKQHSFLAPSLAPSEKLPQFELAVV
ncbi:hypothetical protein ECC02_001387 [Trypanosoma cruzi]|nr:hypothetical protein ECC02_001387 [Trypanosoma cruzi]